MKFHTLINTFQKNPEDKVDFLIQPLFNGYIAAYTVNDVTYFCTLNSKFSIDRNFYQTFPEKINTIVDISNSSSLIERIFIFVFDLFLVRANYSLETKNLLFTIVPHGGGYGDRSAFLTRNLTDGSVEIFNIMAVYPRHVVRKCGEMVCREIANPVSNFVGVNVEPIAYIDSLGLAFDPITKMSIFYVFNTAEGNEWEIIFATEFFRINKSQSKPKHMFNFGDDFCVIYDDCTMYFFTINEILNITESEISITERQELFSSVIDDSAFNQ